MNSFTASSVKISDKVDLHIYRGCLINPLLEEMNRCFHCDSAADYLKVKTCADCGKTACYCCTAKCKDCKQSSVCLNCLFLFSGKLLCAGCFAEYLQDVEVPDNYLFEWQLQPKCTK